MNASVGSLEDYLPEAWHEADNDSEPDSDLDERDSTEKLLPKLPRTIKPGSKNKQHRRKRKTKSFSTGMLLPAGSKKRERMRRMIAAAKPPTKDDIARDILRQVFRGAVVEKASPYNAHTKEVGKRIRIWPSCIPL